MSSKTILLIEDNPSDIALTKRALEKARIANQLVIAEDGQEALDYLLGTGAHAGRDPTDQPMLTLLDLKLPKIPGLEVLKRLRSDPRTRRIPVVVLTSSNEEQDVAAELRSGHQQLYPQACGLQSVRARSGTTWLVLAGFE